MALQRLFDFTELDAEPAQLDLEVDAANEGDAAVGQPAALVAGSVETVAGPPAKRVGDEFFGGQPRLAQISARQSRPADQQLAGHADRRRPQAGVNEVVGQVVDRTANRRRRIRRAGSNLRPGRDDRGFGGSVTIEKGNGGIGRRPALDLVRAGERSAQREPGRLVGGQGHQPLGDLGRSPQRRDAALAEPGEEAAWIEPRFLG